MDKKLRHERILACRYYNGEDKCPEGINELFWNYERGWANGDNQSWQEEKEELKRLGLQYFEADDGTPEEFLCDPQIAYEMTSYYDDIPLDQMPRPTWAMFRAIFGAASYQEIYAEIKKQGLD